MRQKTDETRRVVLQFWAAMQANDWAAAATLFADDYVLDWPQSGERIRGAANFVAVNANYPAAGRWRFTIERLVAEGEVAVTDVLVTDGTLAARFLLPHGAQAKNDRPLEEVLIGVQGGRHHGWPFCTSERPDGQLEPGPGPYVERPDPSGDVPPAPTGFRCEDAVPALFTAVAHTAPLGLARYEGSQFPAEYQGDIFIALHGSWNRTPPAPCEVVRIQIENGQPVAATPFLAGFQRDAGQSCGEAWGRPAGVAVGSDGALYISDDQNGRIYRIVATR